MITENINKNSYISANAYVKWAGANRQLLNETLPRVPSSFDTYYEPFVGGGAVLFALKHDKSVINDINSHLILSYKAIRDTPQDLMDLLDYYDGIKLNATIYKEFREKYNSNIKKNINKLETNAVNIY